MSRFLAIAAAALWALGACDDGGGGGREEAAAPAPAASGSQLIARAELFGDPTRIRGRLSPDGDRVSWLAPHEGALNIWVAPAEAPQDARPITATTDGGVHIYQWARNNTHIISMRDPRGDDNWRVYSVDVATGEESDLTPFGDDVTSWIQAASWDYPDEILIRSNDRDREVFDLHKVNVVTGASERVFENTRGFSKLVTDNALRLRLAEIVEANGDRTLHLRDHDGEWSVFDTIPYEDGGATHIVSFDGANQSVYMIDSRGRDSAALTRVDLADGARELVAGVSGSDVTDVLLHPTTFEAEAVAISRFSTEWAPLTNRADAAFRRLESELDGELMILSRTVDDTRWVVFNWTASNPGTYHVFDVDAGVLEHLLDINPEFAGRPAINTASVVIPSRDGLDLVSYLTLPAGADDNGDGRPERASPLVLLPAVGPWQKARHGFSEERLWLADRGYAVLEVNVRGTRGFGAAFLVAGDGELGAGVQDDVRDAANWAIARGVAQADRVAIFGRRLAGHAAITALARDGDVFRCAVAMNAPADLVRLLEDAPPYWRPFEGELRRRIGDPTDVQGRASLRARSPTTLASAITQPLLIAHGANDPSDQADAAQSVTESAIEAGAAATFVLFPDEGVEFPRPYNNRAFHAAAEAFLADCLGGDMEPFGGDLEGSSMLAPLGAEYVPGLVDALGARRVAQRD